MAASASSPVSDCACFYFDLETSGLNPYCDEIIEIGIKKLVLGTDKERMEAPELSILVKPSRPISETISSLTGITNELLESDGVCLPLHRVTRPNGSKRLYRFHCMTIGHHSWDWRLDSTALRSGLTTFYRFLLLWIFTRPTFTPA